MRRRSGLVDAVLVTRDPSSGGDAPVRLRCRTPGTGPASPTGDVPGEKRTAGPDGPGGPEGRRAASDVERRRDASVRPTCGAAPGGEGHCGLGASGRVRPRSRDLDVVHLAGNDPHRATSTSGAHSQVQALSTRHKHRFGHNPDKSCEVSHRFRPSSCGQPLRQTVTSRDATLTHRSGCRHPGRRGWASGKLPERSCRRHLRPGTCSVSRYALRHNASGRMPCRWHAGGGDLVRIAGDQARAWFGTCLRRTTPS
jgi:hypothetical protein